VQYGELLRRLVDGKPWLPEPNATVLAECAGEETIVSHSSALEITFWGAKKIHARPDSMCSEWERIDSHLETMPSGAELIDFGQSR
jgi:hypothetical protein